MIIFSACRYPAGHWTSVGVALLPAGRVFPETEVIRRNSNSEKSPPPPTIRHLRQEASRKVVVEDRRKESEQK